MFPLLLFWLCFEFGRPPFMLKIPMLISIVSIGGWALRAGKQWSSQSWWLLVFLAVMVIGIPFAENDYHAFWGTKDMVVLFLCICLPLQSLLTSLRRIRLWSYVFLAVVVYVAIWSLLHDGYGPSGSGGAQDENYVAALMGMAIPFAYFSLFADKRRIAKVLLVLALVVFAATLVVQENPSRGGFLGFCAVGLYCVARSPRRLMGFGLVAVMVAVLVAVAGPAYWAEIATSTDYTTGTGATRIEIWKIGIRMWQAHPLLGVGVNSFSWMLGAFQSPEQTAMFGRELTASIIAHSVPVELLAENGIAGFVVVSVVIWRTWAGLGRVCRVRDAALAPTAVTDDVSALACYADATRGAMIAILVNGLFLSLLYYSHMWLLIAIGTAIPHVYRSQVAAAQSGVVTPRIPGTRGANMSGGRPR